MKEEFLVFNMIGVAYGIRLTSVREIITFSGQITPVPNCPDWVLGVINLRGEVVPVIDYRVKFSSRAQLYDSETIIVALREFNSKMISFVVDSIETISLIDTSKIDSTVETALDPRLIEGLAKHQKEMITLLNEQALTDLEKL